MARVLAASLLLHLLVGAALTQLRVPTARPGREPIEWVLAAPTPPSPLRPPSLQSPLPAPTWRARTAEPAPGPPRVAAVASHVAAPSRRALTPTPLLPPQPPAEPPTTPRPAEPSTTRGPVSLFAPSALARSLDIDLAPSAADRAWRPRRGVGGGHGSGGVDVGSFLAEDAARLRAKQGAVAPELRTAERRLDDDFAPSFIQADVSNRAEIFVKQLRGFLRDPPKTGELARSTDPSKETLEEKMRSMHPDQAFFLGRRVEVFVRQRADGSIIEMALRNASGYRAFDDVALAAVEKALAGRVPGSAAPPGGEVRTLWQLDATAYVVISPNPQLVFDETTGKRDWVYPLQKRVDHHVRLMAVY